MNSETKQELKLELDVLQADTKAVLQGKKAADSVGKLK